MFSAGSMSANYILTVVVTDVNDVSPVCSHSLYSLTVSEAAVVGATVGQLTCTDGDNSAPNNQIVSYVISTGNTGS